MDGGVEERAGEPYVHVAHVSMAHVHAAVVHLEVVVCKVLFGVLVLFFGGCSRSRATWRESWATAAEETRVLHQQGYQ